MKRIFGSIVSMGLIAVCGCDNGTAGGKGATPAVKPTTTIPSTTPSTTTTTPSTDKPMLGEAKETFKLTVPTLSTSIKQGESVEVKIGISRGTNFDDDVTVKLGKLPEGVTVTPADPVIPHGASDIKLTVAAADTAALGDFTVSVTGTPAKGGANAENQLKLTVKEK